MKRFLAFDIETAKVLPESISDLLSHRPLGICCAAAFPSDTRKAHTWHGHNESGAPSPQMSQAEARAMVNELSSLVADGYELLTWNGLAFDFDILSEESGNHAECVRLALGHTDMMFHVVCVLGHFLGLKKASEGMRIKGKLAGMSGAEAPAAWAAGRHQDVLDYVAQDVRTTLELGDVCERRRELTWISSRGRPSQIPLPDGWLDVKACLTLPEPDTSWMTNPPTRRQFTAWTHTNRNA